MSRREQRKLCVQFSSVSAVKCPSLDVGLSHCPPLVYVLHETVPVFYTTIQVFPPSRPWSSSFFVCVSPGEVVQRLSVLLATGQFHLSLLIVSIISGTYFGFFSDPFSCFTVSSRDVYHDSFVGSLHSSEFQGLLFPNIPGF